jgi:hypothetical protein
MFKKEGIGKQVDIFVGIVGKGEKWMLQIGKSRLRPMMVWGPRGVPFLFL